jgi:hypothetical protein
LSPVPGQRKPLARFRFASFFEKLEIFGTMSNFFVSVLQHFYSQFLSPMLSSQRPCLFLLCITACIVPYVQAQACTREYMPVCGQVPGEAQSQTFPNQCLLKVANATPMSEGACPGEAVHLIGGDLDAHGCKPSAGYTWSEELASCVRPWLSQAITLEVAPKPGACGGDRDLQCLMAREVPEQRVLKSAKRFKPSKRVRTGKLHGGRASSKRGIKRG